MDDIRTIPRKRSNNQKKKNIRRHANLGNLKSTTVGSADGKIGGGTSENPGWWEKGGGNGVLKRLNNRYS